MNKIFSLVIVTIVIVAGLFLVPQVRDYFSSQFKKITQTQVQTEMSGTIVETKDGSITVSGLVGTEKKIIQFSLTSETILTRGSNIITQEQINSGKNFKPEFVQSAGQVSDLLPKIIISRIQSKENLFTTNSATAVEIDYVTFVLPTK